VFKAELRLPAGLTKSVGHGIKPVRLILVE
jgi:hypothetical protein